jgi:hypothetical protein
MTTAFKPDIGRYWSRDGSNEIDLVAELDTGKLLFGECKWRADSVIRLGDYIGLQAKVANLPDAKWRDEASYILFSVGGFAPELRQIAGDPAERLFLVSGGDLLP